MIVGEVTDIMVSPIFFDQLLRECCLHMHYGEITRKSQGRKGYGVIAA